MGIRKGASLAGREGAKGWVGTLLGSPGLRRPPSNQLPCMQGGWAHPRPDGISTGWAWALDCESSLGIYGARAEASALGSH